MVTLVATVAVSGFDGVPSMAMPATGPSNRECTSIEMLVRTSSPVLVMQTSSFGPGTLPVLQFFGSVHIGRKSRPTQFTVQEGAAAPRAAAAAGPAAARAEAPLTTTIAAGTASASAARAPIARTTIVLNGIPPRSSGPATASATEDNGLR